jgi:uncharacterized membrane protein YheB (UPF0754 family)
LNLTAAGLTILFGAIAGGLTNTVAIWMLFHPYVPPRPFGRPIRSLQGAIPKNQARLASTVGRTVGTRLLTPEDLANTVGAPAFRAAFDERLSSFIRGSLERDWGALLEELTPPIAAEARALADEIVAGLLDRLHDYLASPAFEAAVGRWVEARADELKDRPLGDFLTPDREAAIGEAVDRWIAEAVEGAGFESTVRDYLDRTAARLLQPGRTFEGLIPPGLVAGMERAVAGYLPIALERLAGMLEDPAARDRVQRVLHEILDRFMGDLKFHQRLLAALVITPETVDRVLIAIEAEGADRLSEVLHEPEMRDAMARGVNDAVAEFLRRDVTAVLGQPGDESVEEAKETVAGWAVNLARDEQTRAFLVEKLQQALHAAERRTWGDVFRHVPPERMTEALVAAARSERASRLLRETATAIADRALARPLGRLADRLPPDAADRLERTVAEPVWAWLQEQMPAVAQRIDIAGRVEQKILEYPIPKLEELIRGVTERELRLIVRLGYVLGAFIGLVSALINLLLA